MIMMITRTKCEDIRGRNKVRVMQCSQCDAMAVDAAVDA
jgi:hypothetical protein